MSKSKASITKSPFDCAPFDPAQGLRQGRRKEENTKRRRKTGVADFAIVADGAYSAEVGWATKAGPKPLWRTRLATTTGMEEWGKIRGG